MKYDNIYEGFFLARPNRFIAKVSIDGREETVHVKNTGRCRELLVPGRKVFLEKTANPNRKTAYSLITVDKEGLLVNMDSQVPNAVVQEALLKGKIAGITPNHLRREVTYQNSRFDIYFEQGQKRCLMEVKGVTLEEGGYCRFPDAPTSRGVKHIEELIKALQEGYVTYILFLLQMHGMKRFRPNYETDLAFGKALHKARRSGVQILAYDCIVTKDSIEIDKKVPLYFDPAMEKNFVDG